MKKSLAMFIAVSFLLAPASGVAPFAVARAEAQEYYSDYGPRFSRQQLENLLAPVALYPDPLLAQILVAATFADQIEDAARFMRRTDDPYAVDYQPWDVSVKAVAHYPSVLHMMADRIDWTVALGQAYVDQPGEVMASVQHLRWMAHRAGNLISGPYQEVIVEREYIEIVPYWPEVIYVPVYEPDVIFVHPAAFITFGPAFPIGAWLNRDCDWRGRRVYYHGWRGGRGWIERSRPRVRITNVYVNKNFTNVRVNREANFNNFDLHNRGRAAAEQPAAREDSWRRGRVETAPQSSGNNAVRTREENSARAQGVPQARGDTHPYARENWWQRTREQRPPMASENRSLRTHEQTPPQPWEARPRIREERQPQAFGNRQVRA